jgi:hypothetical protein
MPDGVWIEGFLPGEGLVVNGATWAAQLHPSTADRLAQQWAQEGHTVSIVAMGHGHRAYVRRVVRPMRGAGDVVARMTSAVGIEPCAPCEQRRKKLNRWLPFLT